MKKKILLFNYFLEKCLNKEKLLLKTDDFKTLMLGLVTAKASIFRRTASGCSTEVTYLIRPKFLQEMFVVLCLDAVEHGDNLLGMFGFQKGYAFHHVRANKEDFEDVELTAYLDTIYPDAFVLKKEERAMYAQIVGSFSEMRNSPYYGHLRLKRVAIGKLEVASFDKYTEMIDRAFERLCAQEDFLKMFLLGSKYDIYGVSAPYNKYIKKLDVLLEKNVV